MQQLIQRFWKEPAVCIGVITSVILAILAVVTSASWNAETIVGIIAPTASALGIRSQVTPFVGEHELTPEKQAAKQAAVTAATPTPAQPETTETAPVVDETPSEDTPGDPTK